MTKDKLAPGECTVPAGDDQPICNRDGELVRESLDDAEEDLIEEEPMEDTSESLGDKIAKVWNKTP